MAHYDVNVLGDDVIVCLDRTDAPAFITAMRDLSYYTSAVERRVRGLGQVYKDISVSSVYSRFLSRDIVMYDQLYVHKDAARALAASTHHTALSRIHTTSTHVAGLVAGYSTFYPQTPFLAAKLASLRVMAGKLDSKYSHDKYSIRLQESEHLGDAFYELEHYYNCPPTATPEEPRDLAYGTYRPARKIKTANSHTMPPPEPVESAPPAPAREKRPSRA